MAQGSVRTTADELARLRSDVERLRQQLDELSEQTRSAQRAAREARAALAATRREAAEATQRARRAEHLLSSMGDGVVVLDAAGRITLANRTIARLLGVPVADLIGRSAFDLLDPADAGPALARFADEISRRPTADHQERFRFRVRSPGGETIPVELVGEVLLDDPVIQGVVLSVRDLRQPEAVEAALARRTRFDALAADIAQLALDLGPDGFLARLPMTLERIAAELGVDACAVEDLDPAERTVALRGGWSTPATGLVGAGLASVAAPNWLRALAAVPVLADDGSGEPPWRPERARAAGWCPRAVLAAPIRTGGRLVSALVLETGREHRWQDEEISVARKLAATVASQVERQQVERALRRSEARLQALFANTGDLLMVVGRDGIIQYGSPASEPLLGLPVNRLGGMSVRDLLHPDDLAAGLAALSQSTSRCGQTPIVARLRHHDGRWRWFEIAIGVLDDPGADVTAGGLVLAARDVHARIEADELARRRQTFDDFALRVAHDALDGSPAAFVAHLDTVVEGLCGVLGADRGCIAAIDGDIVRSLGGWAAPGSDADGWRAGDDVALPTWVAELRRLEPVVVTDHEAPRPPAWIDECRRVGRLERASLSVPLSVAGHLIGVLGVAMARQPRTWDDDEVALVRRVADTVANVLERQRTEDALRASEARLSAVFASTSDGVGLLGRDGRVQFVNPAFADLLRHPPADVVDRTLTEFVHPADLGVVLEGLSRAGTGEAVVLHPVRLCGADDRTVWVDLRLAPSGSFTATEDSCSLVFTVRDVTERRQAEEADALRQSYERFAFTAAQQALDLGPTGFVARLPMLLAEIGALLGVDAVIADAIDLDAGMLRNLGVWTRPWVPDGFVADDVSLSGLPAWVAALATGGPIVSPDTDLADDPWVAELDAFPVRVRARLAVPLSVGGRLTGVVSIAQLHEPRAWTSAELTLLRQIGDTIANVLERRVLEAELERQALHDPLTGLANRALMQSRLTVATARRVRPNDVAVLVIDLDGFKDVNDRLGHAAGDQLLVVIAERLANLTRPADTLARFGGDEFVLVCPETTVEGALAIGHRVVDAVARPVVIEGMEVTVGASVGIAHSEGTVSDPDRLLLDADDAMYEAKRAGRGCVRVAASAAVPRTLG